MRTLKELALLLSHSCPVLPVRLLIIFCAPGGEGGRRGYLIGWNTAAFKCLVVTLVTVDADTGLPTLDQV